MLWRLWYLHFKFWNRVHCIQWSIECYVCSIRTSSNCVMLVLWSLTSQNTQTTCNSMFGYFGLFATTIVTLLLQYWFWNLNMFSMCWNSNELFIFKAPSCWSWHMFSSQFNRLCSQWSCLMECTTSKTSKSLKSCRLHTESWLSSLEFFSSKKLEGGHHHSSLPSPSPLMTSLLTIARYCNYCQH